MKPTDLHQGHLVPINGYNWAVNSENYWMVRADKIDRRMTYMDFEGRDFPLLKADTSATRLMLCTVTRELVLFPHDEGRQAFIEPGKKILDAVPSKVWTPTPFLFDDMLGQRVLFAHDDELAALDPAYVKLAAGPGEWRNDGAVEPFYRVDGGEVMALVMPVRTVLNFRLPVAA